MKKPIFGQKAPKCIVQCLVSYFRDPENFFICFSNSFQAGTGKKLWGKKSTNNFTGPGNLMLDTQLISS